MSVLSQATHDALDKARAHLNDLLVDLRAFEQERNSLLMQIAGHKTSMAEITKATGCTHAADVVAYVNSLQPKLDCVEDVLKATDHQSLPELRDAYLALKNIEGIPRLLHELVIDTIKANYRVVKPGEKTVGFSAKRPASSSFEDYFRSRDLRLTSLSVGHDRERHRHMFTLSDGSYFETSNAALAASLYEALLRG